MNKVILGLVWAAAGFAQPLTFSLVASGGPSARVDGTIAYDAAGKQVFLFGGQDTSARNDLWAYSLERKEWVEVAASGSRPPARFGHTTVIDGRRRLIVFGGQAGGFFSDVWAYDIARGSWEQLARDDAGPNRRYGHSAIYDERRNRVVISHGFTDDGRFDDTWAFDLTTNRWRELTPSGSKPLRRCLHHAVYAPEADQMFLYGGCASGFGPCPLGDLWAFDLERNRWTERTGGTKPPAREHYGFTFDNSRGRLVVHGGLGNGTLNDTWFYDAARNTWEQAAIAGAVPAARARLQGTFATDLRTSFFFGGRTNTGLTNELWSLGPLTAGAPEITAVTNAFSGSAGALAPGELVSIYGTNLGPLTGVATSFGPDDFLPTSYPGVSVSVNGVPAPILFARTDQLNIQIPYEVAGSGRAEIRVTSTGSVSPAVTVPVAASAPGLFRHIAAVEPGGVVVLYVTGEGQTAPPGVSGRKAGEPLLRPALVPVVTLGGERLEILYAGQAPGTAGVMQINAQVPAGIGASEAHEIRVQIGEGMTQNGVTVAVR